MHETSPRFISAITRETLALVLAGGRGSRLGELTAHRAKPAVPFGGKYRIIDFPLSNCLNSNIRRIGVVSQYMAHPLIRHLHQGWGFLRGEFNEFIELLPAQQRMGEAWYSGTANAVYQNLEIIREHQPSCVLILGGDHVYKMDYGPMIGAHTRNQADVTVACVDVALEDARSFGVIVADDAGRIGMFLEKPDAPPAMPGKPDRALASMGVYVFSTEYLLRVLKEDSQDPDSSHDFGKDILPKALARGHAAYAFPFQGPDGDHSGYWRDVGTIDSYWEANLELVSVAPALNLYDQDWPIWTHQQQYPPAKFVFDDDGRRGMAVDSMVSGGCIVSGAQVRRSLLFSNVTIEHHSMIEQSVILPNVRIGRNCQIRRAIVDAGSHIPDGTRIGVSAEEDSQRFQISPGGIVVVTPDSIGGRIEHGG